MNPSSAHTLRLLQARRHRAQNEQVAFHGTKRSNLPAIQAVGLVPQVGDNTEDTEGPDVEAKVCVSLDKKIAKSYANKHKDGVVLKVDLDHPDISSHPRNPDENEPRSLTYNRRLPPDAITVEAWERVPPKYSERDGEPTASDLALMRDFKFHSKIDGGKFGEISRYTHKNGDNLIVTELHPDIRDSSPRWSTKWEYHSTHGVKSSGHDTGTLARHLSKVFTRR